MLLSTAVPRGYTHVGLVSDSSTVAEGLAFRELEQEERAAGPQSLYCLPWTMLMPLGGESIRHTELPRDKCQCLPTSELHGQGEGAALVEVQGAGPNAEMRPGNKWSLV